MKQKITAAIDLYRQHIINCGEYIKKNPELGFKEFKTSEFIKKEFEKLGLECQCGLALTGVKATVGKKDADINVCIIGEMDAIKCLGHPDADPVTGAAHACGHNAQIAALLGAAYGLVKSKVLEELNGKVTFFAVPAEEYAELEYRLQLRKEGKISYLGGKQELIHTGAFDDVDIAMMVHGDTADESPSLISGGTSLGFVAKNITFHGVAAHGSRPEAGINALNAAMLALMGINANRETFKEKDRVKIHPIVTNGGELVNVIPSYTRIETFVRAANKKAIDDACEKVDRAVRAGAMAVGATCQIEDIPGYFPLDQDPQLDLIFEQNALMLCPDMTVYHDRDMFGSTDMGNLCAVIPSIHPRISGFSGKAHGTDYVISDPESAYILPGKLMAMTAYDLLKDNAALGKKIKQDFKARKNSV